MERKYKSTKFAAEIIGSDIPEQTKADIAHEIQATVLRHIARIDRSAYVRQIGPDVGKGTKSESEKAAFIPPQWRGLIAIFKGGPLDNTTIGQLDKGKIQKDIQISEF